MIKKILLICIILLAGIFAIANAEETVQYPGFSDIDQSKNFFILVGDTQLTSKWEFWRERNKKERGLIINEIYKQDPAFIINLGDLTARGSSEKHWQEFDDLRKQFKDKKIPYFPVLGNHELYGNNETALQYYFSRFPHLNHQRWYSFNWKNIGFIMLETNFADLTNEQLNEQNKFYLNELEKFEKDKNIRYIIVCCHKPPFTNNRTMPPSKEAETYFAEPFVKAKKTVLFFSGHSHSYERFEKNGKFFIISGGGGGPRHKLTKHDYKDLFDGPELRFFNFCRIELKKNSLQFEVYKLEENGNFSVAEALEIK
jgi:3',5'-cyclic AMP phosphodiesterase CpdA